MRGILRQLGARGGAVVVLVLVIVVVIVLAKLVGGGTGVSKPAVVVAPSNSQSPVVDATDGDDAQVAETPSAYPDNAEVLGVAAAFLTAWLKTDLSPTAWHRGLEPLSTTALSGKLAGVDPAGVPATRTTGSATIARRDSAFAQVNMPVDTGTVVLNLVKDDKGWLVDGVDWDRA